MTTATRIRALQWFYDRGAVIKALAEPDAPSPHIMGRMDADGQLHLTDEGWTLTDKGRRALHEGRA